MQLELATVISCSPTGCRVKPLDGSPEYETNYSALVLGRVRIYPGQLVAVDMSPAVPEIAWRWHKVTIVEAHEDQVLVQDRERQMPALRIPGMETDAHPGDEVWVTGMAGAQSWELHDRVVGGQPTNPARLREVVLPRIADQLASYPRS